MGRLNDASVNGSIRLYLRVMIIIRQERRNKARAEKRMEEEFGRGNEIVGMKFTFFKWKRRKKTVGLVLLSGRILVGVC